MITLITGLPGNGKTLYALWWVKQKAEAEGRPVFYSGIKDLAIPGWTECDPEKWFELPANSIIVIDECQRVFRPRMHGSTVPPHVSRLETHRHQGVDIVLITQHPMLLDSNARRLVGDHKHVVRKFGMHWSTIHSWTAVKDSCDKNRADSMKLEWRYPKDVFSLYKSAEVHTVKRSVPARIWLLLAIILAVPSLAWWWWDRRQAEISGEGKHAPQAVSGAPGHAVGTPGGAVPGSVAAQGPKASLTPSEYAAQFAPRVAGLAYTAPVYDGVTMPTEAPFPAACVAAASRCTCYSQQATRLDVPDYLCRQLVERGFFVAWREKASPQNGTGGVKTDRSMPGYALSGPDAGGPVVIDLGGTPARYLGGQAAAAPSK